MIKGLNLEGVLESDRKESKYLILVQNYGVLWVKWGVGVFDDATFINFAETPLINQKSKPLYQDRRKKLKTHSKIKIVHFSR